MKYKCVKTKPWVSGRHGRITSGPKRNEIVTLSRIFMENEQQYFVFEEYPDNQGYNSKSFRPVDENPFREVTFEKIKEKVPLTSAN